MRQDAPLEEERPRRLGRSARRSRSGIGQAVRSAEFRRGVMAAAAVAQDYDRSSTHPYRLGDCIACKLNVVARKRPRRNRKPRPAGQSPPDLAYSSHHYTTTLASDRVFRLPMTGGSGAPQSASCPPLASPGILTQPTPTPHPATRSDTTGRRSSPASRAPRPAPRRIAPASTRGNRFATPRETPRPA